MDDGPDPQAILDIATGTWRTAVLAAAVEHGVFTHIEAGRNTAAALADAASLSARGAQALLDGLVGLGLLTVGDGRYANTPQASTFLVRHSPVYLGPWITYHASDMAEWSRFGRVVRTGEPAFREDEVLVDVADLARALAPLSLVPAARAADRLGLAEAGAVSILDVGGGVGAFSALWLNENEQSTSTQIELAPVNAAAREYVSGHGAGDRFHTRDGDARLVDWGVDEYDIGVFCNVAHALGPEENREAFAKFRRAIVRGGTLVVVDFVLEDDRSGPPMALLFNDTMLIRTARGAAWTESDFRRWLDGAGFTEVTVERTDTPISLVYAR
jgi:SAM-dependent methyltransferase